ncbi:ABC transporter substrate-binding protein [Nocardia sp.]|uniref:ABC transporter substrate-binding protein n=1 Tax=Nocardia sp. TaxID=1821 RepID=UPI0025826DCF|nr:ABC transporter substrate-binding protein [Nocardia sp.]
MPGEGEILKLKRTVVAAIALAMLAAGCAGRSTSDQEAEPHAAEPGNFGDLSSICHEGATTSAPTRGVTATEIKVGVFSDIGFTKQSEFVDAAEVFTSWCNAAGGINGRKILAEVRDTNLMEVRQRMLDACREDFVLVGGGAALDGLGVKDRLSCLLPEFPAQVSQAQNLQSDLQITALAGTYAHYEPYFGFRSWLLREAYPESAGAVGIITGDSPVTKVLSDKAAEAIRAAGGTVTYSDLYPATGVSDWTPYAQAIKNKGVKGLVFYGDYRQLAKLEDVLTSIDYKLDWVDPTNNSYNSQFLEAAAQSIQKQNNVIDLSGAVPIEAVEASPAMKQMHDIYTKYAPDAELTLNSVRAFSAWLLFAKAATRCGDQLTRRCVVEAAGNESGWSGGGLHTARDLSDKDAAPQCFNVVQATPSGWKQADFKPDQGLFRCNIALYRYIGNYGSPTTLADVGKSFNDVE